jgi:two-component system, cell cycle sensor histidine kinase and response regulator CckA
MAAPLVVGRSGWAVQWPYVAAALVVVLVAGLLLGRRSSRPAGPRQETHDAGFALPANDIVLLMDETGRIVEANDRASESYGYAPSELTGMNIRDLRYGDERETLKGQWSDIGDRGSLRFETVHRRRDGSSVPVEVSSRVVHVGGRPFRQSIIRDITERKQTEEMLKKTLETLAQSEARLRRVVEKAPEAIIVEIGRVVRYANPAAVELIGAKTESEVLGLNMLDFTHPEERDQVVRRSAMVASGHSVPVAQRRIMSFQGEWKYVEASAAPIEYEGEAASLVFFRDVTERHKGEAEKAALEAQLAQAQRLESIGRLAGGVAHDFNNHLTVINGYCDMLLAQLDAGDPVRESITEIRAAGERAAGLTGQLLAFSRKQVIEPAPVGLNEAIADATRMIRRLIGEDVEMVTRMEPACPVIMADKGQLDQILLNLAVNARDAMPNGGVFTLQTGAVEIDAYYAAHHPEAREGSFATLTVSDNGIGMSRDVAGQIFEPFFTTKKAGAGTGLGLSTVYGIVRQAGGWIRVYSEPGMGATFAMYFPRVDAVAETSSAEGNGEAALGGSETILVVEDQQDVRRLTIAALGRIGYRTIEACDGADAIRKASEFEDGIDLLLTDVVMPGMSGIELADRLAQLRPSTRVLYTSGYTEEAIGSNRMLTSDCLYLAKPFTAAQLASKVRDALISGSASSEASA